MVFIAVFVDEKHLMVEKERGYPLTTVVSLTIKQEIENSFEKRKPAISMGSIHGREVCLIPFPGIYTMF